MKAHVESPELHYGDMYDEDIYAELRLRQYASLLGRNLERGARVFEIGCYTARLRDLLPDHFEYFGVDYDTAALKIAQGKGTNVRKLDIERDGLDCWGGTRFDAVVLTEVLEHLQNPQNLMAQLGAVMKPDGVVLVSLPNENTFYHRLVALFGYGIDSCAFQPFKHLHLPTIKQSEQFLGLYLDIKDKSYYINPGGQGSRFESLGAVATLIPDYAWRLSARILPNLFARGVIFCATLRVDGK